MMFPATVKNVVGMEFVLIPAGRFQMGTNKDEVAKPVRAVTIPNPLYFGKFPVTQAQWMAVMGDNPSKFRGDDLPVERVGWDDCQTYIERLNALDPTYVHRLPSEAEWEYACRAGVKSDSAPSLLDVAWYARNALGKTHPVGLKKPNRFGLYDLRGNVWEWCRDLWFDNYRDAPTDGSAREDGEGKLRVLRGGSWDGHIYYSRATTRVQGRPTRLAPTVGFRLVLEARWVEGSND